MYETDEAPFLWVAVSEWADSVGVVKVFISSVTYALAAERNGLATLLKVVPPYEPRRFEDFTAQDRSSREACLAGVEDCDVYVLLLGPRYGDPLSDSGKAPTEEEFEHARRLGKRILAFVKITDEVDEPLQAAFKARVQSYVNGYFRDAFRDTETLNVAVLSALRDLTQTPAGPGWVSLSQPMPLLWRWDVPSVQDPALAAPVLDVHLVPLDAQPLRATLLQGLPAMLARSGREAGFFAEADAVDTNTASDVAWAWVHEGRATSGSWDAKREHQHRGLLVHRSGQVTAFEALPTDMMGALVDTSELQTRLARLVRLAARHVPGDARSVALAASLRPLDSVFEGNPSDVGSRNRGTMRMRLGSGAVMHPSTSVTAQALLDHTGDVVAEMAAELLDGIRQAQ